jgi:4-amino-4-deoxy-L-arabinose transferase-like glycosyltransferase
VTAAGARSPTAPPGQRHFRVWLLVIAGFALAIRILYTFTISPPLAKVGDDSFYYYASSLIAQGHGYAQPFTYAFQGRLVPTAAHPPLWPFLLAFVSLFTGPTAGVGSLVGPAADVHRILGCLLGAGAVFLIGLLGRRIGGWRVGLLAAAIAAVYPHFITLDGYLLGEPLYGVLVGGLLIVSYDFAARPSRLRALALGVLVGLAALTRQEALLFVPVLVLPLALRTGRTRGLYAGLAVLGTVIVVGPWTIRNYVAYHRFVPVANTTGTVIAGANCHTTYYGSDLGAWNQACANAVSNPSANEAAVSSQQVSTGLRYAGRHQARAVLIAAVRLLRIWSLYAPNDQAIGNRSFLWVGVALYWGLLVMATIALVRLRRTGRDVLILVSAAIVTSLAAIFGDGLDRLRYGAEIPLIALGAWAVVWLYTRLARAGTLGNMTRMLIAPRYESTVGARDE